MDAPLKIGESTGRFGNFEDGVLEFSPISNDGIKLRFKLGKPELQDNPIQLIDDRMLNASRNVTHEHRAECLIMLNETLRSS